MPRLLDPAALAAVLPHRGCNLIPDEVVVADDGRSSTARVRVPAGDERGRTVFMRRAGDGTPCWYEPFVLEFLALAGIPLIAARLAPGQAAVFSAIARVAIHGLAPSAEELLGEARIVRERPPFTVFATSAQCAGRCVLEAEVMSGAAELAAIAGEPPCPAPPPAAAPLADWPWKPRHLRFVDGVVAWRAEARRVHCAYTYPPDHPFVPGHFPGAPLMMGVTQLAAVADAALVALERLGQRAGAADGRVQRADGREVAEVRGLQLIEDGGVPRLAALQRIAFRSPVRPGEALLIEAALA
ncbi:MAG: hypothetical protein RMM29_00180 [Planctomycetota bacterium]|nr:hypothetical protein [Planctomycetota bacterium]MDW8372051.1 hypothetical protein [Planctomycetota bacterium]